jgi:hypothetical protein
MLNATIESTIGLTLDEAAALKAAACGCMNMESLDKACSELRAWFPGWIVYRGGSHVAVHRTSGGDRLVFIVDAVPAIA